jgi:hypothetical protein
MKKLYVALSVSLSVFFGAVTANAYTAYFEFGDGLNFDILQGFDLFAGAGGGTDKPGDLSMTLYYQGAATPIGTVGSIPHDLVPGAVVAYDIFPASYGVSALRNYDSGSVPGWDTNFIPGTVLSLTSAAPFTLYQIDLLATNPSGHYLEPYTISSLAIADGMIYTAANPVPVPAAAWLLGSGLLGLIGLRRKNS